MSELAIRVLLARVWLALCVGLAAAGPVVAWPAFKDFVKGDGRMTVVAEVARYGFDVSASETLVFGMLLVSLAVKMAVFAGSAVALAWKGGDRPFPIVLAGGVLAYGVGIGLPVEHSPAQYAWVLELNLIFAIGTLARATLTLPEEAFLQRWRAVFFAAWVAVVWLLLNPVGVPGWEGLRGHRTVSSVIHLVLVGVGLAAMGARYVEQPADRRQQMEWFVWGVAASAIAFAVKLILRGGVAGEIFAGVVYPVLQCCTVLALTVSVLRYGLWSLGRVLPVFFKAAFFVAAVSGLSIFLGGFIIEAWKARGGHPLPAMALCVAISFMVVTYGRGALARAVGYAFFPNSGHREEAINLGAAALEDATNEAEVFWALEGVFAHGWPGSRVKLLGVSRTGPLPSPEEALAAEAPALADDLRLVDGISGAPPTLWMTLSVHGECVGVVRVVPSTSEVIADRDLESIRRLARPLAQAVWRVSQPLRFRE